MSSQCKYCLYGCPVPMLFSYIWNWPLSRSEKRMHRILGWCRMVPMHVHNPYAPEGSNQYFMTSLNSTIQTSLLPCFTQKASNNKPQPHLAYWIIRENSAISNHVKWHVILDLQKIWFPAQAVLTMADLKGKIWILRLDPPNTTENLQPSSVPGRVWKCWCDCRILI